MFIITLVRRSFKILIVIFIRFNFEILEYNAVNIFINAPLNKTIHIRIPIGYKEKEKVLYLYKALYGLRKSLLL